MTEQKTCTKCGGTLVEGRVAQHNVFTSKSHYEYWFAPTDEPGPDLSRMLSGKPIAAARKALVLFACDSCGFTEVYTRKVD